jgi:glycosyltransferase involved in cell wall biosynthesis
MFDYFLHAHRYDLAEEAGSETSADYFHWRRAANAMDLLDLENGVKPWTPTRWQRDLFPAEYHADFIVLHDGIAAGKGDCPFEDRGTVPFSGDKPLRSVAGRPIPPESKVVTFIARQLERLRGFDRFVHLANRLMKRSSEVLCIVVGAPLVQRGLDVAFFNRDYKAHVLQSTPPYDPDRLWFLDAVAPSVVVEVLAASDLHVYPSRPYALSRSVLEAMASGCVVLAWDSDPIREFLVHGQNGLLVAPQDSDAQEQLAVAVLDDPASHHPLGEAAAATIREQYARDVVLPELARFLNEAAASPH